MSDPGCTGPDDNNERCTGGGGCPVCDDGTDNDFDGIADYSGNGDPGCFDVFDPSESGDLECDDDSDNDGDGFIDFQTGKHDPGCMSPADPDEHASGLICDNGIDDDQDGVADYAPRHGR